MARTRGLLCHPLGLAVDQHQYGHVFLHFFLWLAAGVAFRVTDSGRGPAWLTIWVTFFSQRPTHEAVGEMLCIQIVRQQGKRRGYYDMSNSSGCGKPWCLRGPYVMNSGILLEHSVQRLPGLFLCSWPFQVLPPRAHLRSTSVDIKVLQNLHGGLSSRVVHNLWFQSRGVFPSRLCGNSGYIHQYEQKLATL